MTNQNRKLKIILNGCLFIFFAGILFYTDLLFFHSFHKMFAQFLLCMFIILATRQRSALFLGISLFFLSLESIIFFGQLEYMLFFALLAYITVKLLNDVIQMSLAIPLISLTTNLIIQKTFTSLYLHYPYTDFLYTIGHFSFNLLFLMLYWIFENNGK
jgi:hypothetical protein